uniref:Glycosyl transferase n=1 Tax=Macrostomum lignano TaxID=282301 RepID=A0A1I8H2V4_9PLAT
EIPRLLHFITDSELVLNGYRQTLASCAAVNPDWTIYLWTELDVESLLRRRQPDLLSFYQLLNSPAERLEFAKYPVLYHLGGVILELDVECLKPLSSATALDFRSSAFVAEERVENVMIYGNRLFRLSPAALGSRPGHGFLGFVISALRGNVSVE